MGYQVNHKRIRERYTPAASASERRHHDAVMQHGCLVCGYNSIAHHILQDSPNKRWRRDHLLVVPLCDVHHRELHGAGNELAWQERYGLDLANEAELLRTESIYMGIL